ncbi:MAG: c-type cytochrome [Bacteroidia bacterium]
MNTKILLPVILSLALLVSVILTLFDMPKDNSSEKNDEVKNTEVAENQLWTKPDESTIPDNDEGKLILYGKDLIANTSIYFGPKGSVAQITNGMNCNNCHLEAGTKPFGNNYSAVASTYPKFRERSGSIETIPKRINDCFERSLNGRAIDTQSREMLAMVAYMKWLGSNVKPKEVPEGSGIFKVPFLNRAASPEKGKLVYLEKCQSCHQANGEGLLNENKTAYAFPPLWGKNSYNSGAGLYRLSRFAGYVKANMPLGASHNNSLLTDEEAWDVAAFVNSMPRPSKDLSKDWPDISGKPIDHPFGPYHDGFSEEQHKYGPFEPIVKKRKELKKQKSSKV